MVAGYRYDQERWRREHEQLRALLLRGVVDWTDEDVIVDQAIDPRAAICDQCEEGTATQPVCPSMLPYDDALALFTGPRVRYHHHHGPSCTSGGRHAER